MPNADYQSIYRGSEMDDRWGKAGTAVQGVKVNGTEVSKDAQSKVNLTLNKASVGLGNVDNTSDANKPVSTAQAAINADLESRKANKDGYYEQMGVGYAKSLLGNGAATQETIDFRPSGGTKDIGTGVETLKAIKGNSVVWNQLVGDNTASVTLISGRKYRVKDTTDGTDTIITGAGTAISVVGGADMVQDLTQMFGAGNEPTTLDDPRIKWLESFGYIPYNEGTLLNFKGEGLKTTGFNQFDDEYGDTSLLYGYGQWGSKNLIKVIPNQAYHFYNEDGKVAFFRIYDSDMNVITENVRVDSTPYTMPDNAAYAIFYLYATDTGYNGKSCFNLSHSGVKNGEYEPYEEHTLALPITSLKANGVTIFPDGMKSAGTAKDELYGNSLGVITKAKKACGVRAYQSGDESDTTLVTDGTNTIYPLDTPVEYALDTPINTTTYVNDWGTEEVLPQGKDAQGLPKTTPLNAEIMYAPNVQDAIRNLPKNYIGKESMDAILEAFKTAGIIASFTLTFDATSGKYNCSITKQS